MPNDGYFQELRSLPTVAKGGGAYYLELAKSSDDLVRCGAISQLLALKSLHPELWDEVVALSRHGSIKQRAFEYFESVYEHEYARDVAQTRAANLDEAASALMQAELAGSLTEVVEQNVAFFLGTGELRYLLRAAGAAEQLGGWKESVPWLVRAVALFPLDSQGAIQLLHVLFQSNQFDLVDEVIRHLARAGLHDYVHGVFTALNFLARGDAGACLRKLNELRPPARETAAHKRATSMALKAKGDAYEKLGDFKLAYRAYVEMNRHDLSPAIVGTQVIEAVERLAAVKIPTLPRAARSDIVMMVGFARSGTTLLETVLGAHPLLEALEEQQTWESVPSFIWLGRRKVQHQSADERSFFEAARNRYFAEVDRRRKKVGASIVIDKFPMRSTSAVPMVKLLPEQRFIFCIRHPFDVVLSCFKQRFAANVGMENFRTFEGSIELYDFTMRQWFSVHDMTDPNVHYLRYDDLVTEFEAVVARALDFVGVPWDDGVRNFVDEANKRATLTPSYQKIRQGLSLGVQTYWRDYRFLFESEAARPLHQWAHFFGYETS